MSEALVAELIVLASTAAGLVLLGIAKFTLAGRPAGVRVAAGLAACAVAAAGPLLSGYLWSAATPIGLLALAGGAFVLLGNDRAVAVLRRPGVQAGLFCGLGGALLVGSLARFEAREKDRVDRDMDYIQEVTWKPPLREVPDHTATTDAGRPVPLWEPREVRAAKEVVAAEKRILSGLGFSERLIRTGAAGEATNCHGWVFAAGRYWVANDDVETILTDNRYEVVSLPRPGDLIVYRDNGKVTHTAIVRSAMGAGQALVEGKWGWMGTFLHAPEGSCYGPRFSYYRSPRDGHCLAEPLARAGPAGAVKTD